MVTPSPGFNTPYTAQTPYPSNATHLDQMSAAVTSMPGFISSGLNMGPLLSTGNLATWLADSNNFYPATVGPQGLLGDFGPLPEGDAPLNLWNQVLNDDPKPGFLI